MLTPYVQIQGLARFTTDEAERHSFWRKRLELVFAGPDDPDYGVIIITPYRIEYWTPGMGILLTPPTTTCCGS
jgi:general stress protein 26